MFKSKQELGKSYKELLEIEAFFIFYAPTFQKLY